MNRFKSLQYYLGTGALTVAMSLASFGASAGLSVSSQIYDGLNQFDDNDAEMQNIDTNQNGRLDVGDTLAGWLNINEIFELDSNGDKTGNSNALGIEFGGTTFVNELTGYFEVVVTSRTYVGEGDGSADNGLEDDTDIYLFTFGAYAPFDNGLDGIDGTADDLPTGSMYALYEDTNANFDITDVTTAQDGTLVMVFGFDGLDNDEQQTALGPLAPTEISAGSAAGTFNIQASILYQALTGLILNPDAVATGCGGTTNPCIAPAGNSLVDVNASGALEGGIANCDGCVSSDVQFTVNATRIPAPAPLGLLSLGIIALGLFNMRRQRASS